MSVVNFPTGPGKTNASDSNQSDGGNSGGGDMETRVAKLEQNIGEIKTDIAVIKVRLDNLEKNAATKTDLADLKIELRTDLAELKAEFRTQLAEIRGEFKTDLGNIKAGFKTDLGDLKAALSDTRTDLMRWTISTLIAGIGVASAVVFGIVKSFPSQPPQIYLQAPAQPGPAVPVQPKTNPPASP